MGGGFGWEKFEGRSIYFILSVLEYMFTVLFTSLICVRPSLVSIQKLIVDITIHKEEFQQSPRYMKSLTIPTAQEIDLLQKMFT